MSKILSVAENMVSVDRETRPPYPAWARQVMHPELESTGPAEFDASALELWLHPQQAREWTRGQVIYDHLNNENMLSGCLGLSDLVAIQARGLSFYRKFFSGKVLVGWKSVVQDADGYLSVPCLFEYDGGVVLSGLWFDDDFDSDYPAPRFAK